LIGLSVGEEEQGNKEELLKFSCMEIHTVSEIRTWPSSSHRNGAHAKDLGVLRP
jgi:hypothetical protein